jgi:hypothetical protein
MVCVSSEEFQGDTITIRVQEVEPVPRPVQKARRNKERTIGEAVEKVQLWRGKYGAQAGDGRKLTLTEVAK